MLIPIFFNSSLKSISSQICDHISTISTRFRQNSIPHTDLSINTCSTTNYFVLRKFSCHLHITVWFAVTAFIVWDSSTIKEKVSKKSFNWIMKLMAALTNIMTNFWQTSINKSDIKFFSLKSNYQSIFYDFFNKKLFSQSSKFSEIL